MRKGQRQTEQTESKDNVILNPGKFVSLDFWAVSRVATVILPKPCIPVHYNLTVYIYTVPCMCP